MAMELSSTTWKLAFSDQLGRNPRVRTIDAGDFVAMCEEIEATLRVFKLDEDTPVISCYEAGRDGFWIHRSLVALDIESHIVEPASIQVTRKKRRAKSAAGNNLKAARSPRGRRKGQGGDGFNISYEHQTTYVA